MKNGTLIGVKDKYGNAIRCGDLVRYNLQGEHTKREYWNPVYRVIWQAPKFTLKWVGGGKDDGSHDFMLCYGGANGVLEIISKVSVPEFDPSNFVLVPREPTPEMVRLGLKAISDTQKAWRGLSPNEEGKKVRSNQRLLATWAAMVKEGEAYGRDRVEQEG